MQCFIAFKSEVTMQVKCDKVKTILHKLPMILQIHVLCCVPILFGVISSGLFSKCNKISMASIPSQCTEICLLQVRKEGTFALRSAWNVDWCLRREFQSEQQSQKKWTNNEQ